MNKFIFLFLISLMSLSFVSATTYLDSETILNNTAGTTMTFSTPIYVENITIEDSNITLVNVQCIVSGTNISSVFWDSVDTKDSGEYCTAFYSCSQTDRMSFNLILILSALAICSFVLYYGYNGFINGTISVGSLIVMFIGVIVSVILFVQSAQNLGGAC